MLDLSRVLAGPWATQILGDLGADIIKIEKPGEGDETRHFGPPFLETPDGGKGDAVYFLSANRNKKSVAIDFAKPEGAALIKRLARRAHVVVENFKTGTMARYGLDYPSLAADNPALIYCSLTGFGHNGPYKDKAGYDYLIQGMGGLMSITGQPDGSPGAEPMKVGVAVSDLVTGLYTTIAILAALLHQSRTGEGQEIDMALFDCQAAALANQAANHLIGGIGAIAPRQCASQHRAVPDVRDGGRLSHSRGGERRAVSPACAKRPAKTHSPAIRGSSPMPLRVKHREVLVPLLGGTCSAGKTRATGSRCWSARTCRAARSTASMRCLPIRRRSRAR